MSECHEITVHLSCDMSRNLRILADLASKNDEIDLIDLILAATRLEIMSQNVGDRITLTAV